MTLNDLKVGERAMVLSVDAERELRHHFLDMGLTPKTILTLVKVAPMEDPLEFNVRGYELTLRVEDAKRMTIEKVNAKEQLDDDHSRMEYEDHPHIGEPGIHHNPNEKIVLLQCAIAWIVAELVHLAGMLIA